MASTRPARSLNCYHKFHGAVRTNTAGNAFTTELVWVTSLIADKLQTGDISNSHLEKCKPGNCYHAKYTAGKTGMP